MSKTLKYIFFICTGLSMLLSWVFRAEHPHFWWEKIPMFDAFYGFLGCIIIVLGSKWLGHHGIQKDEDYYND